MLVLGVGHAAGAESVGSGRVVETVVGAIAGVLVNIAFPPPVEPGTRVVPSRPSPTRSRRSCRWRPMRSGAARSRSTSPRSGWRTPVGSIANPPASTGSLAQLEESRRLNLRALRHPQEGGLRSNLDALEHSSVSMRTLFRAIHDATQRRTGVQDDPDYAENVRCSAAVLMADMATVFRAFGRCAMAASMARPRSEHAELASALETLRRRRDTLEDVLIGDPRVRQGLWELNSALVTTVDRMLLELDATMITPTSTSVARRKRSPGCARRSTTPPTDPTREAHRGQGPPESTEHP